MEDNGAPDAGMSHVTDPNNDTSQQSNYDPSQVSIPNISVGTINLNSLYKLKNINNVHMSSAFSFKRSKRKLEILPSIIGRLAKNDIVCLTDVRLNLHDAADLKRQLFQSHLVYSTKSDVKRAGVSILVKRS